MSLANIKHHIQLLENIQTQSLTQSSLCIEEPPGIKKKLFPHQLASIYAMEEKEILFQTGYKTSTETLYSNYGILGEDAGTGKTLTILGYLSHLANLPAKNPERFILHPSSKPSFFSTSIEEPSHTLLSTLIIVPHTLYKYWQITIEEDTLFKDCFFIKTQKDILSVREELIKRLQTTPLTLISNTMLSSLMNKLKYFSIERQEIFRWKRIFYDEADIIKISSICPVPEANMNWFITSTPLNFLMFNSYYNTHYLRNLPEEFIQSLSPEVRDNIKTLIQQNASSFIFSVLSRGFFKGFLNNIHPLRYYLLVNCSKLFLNTSIPMIPPSYKTILCQQPISHSRAIPTELHNSLQQEDLSGVYQSLGISSFTPQTLPDNLQEKYSLTQVEKDFCAICCEEQKAPCLIPCCGKLFCSSCILEWMKRLATCPLCRTPCLPHSLLHISSCSVNRKKELLPTKSEQFIDFLNQNQNKKIVVVTRFEYINFDMDIEIKDPCAFFHGSKEALYSLTYDFNHRNLNILFVDGTVQTAGFSFSSADYIVFLFKYSYQDMQKFIGRVQRLDRTTPLTIVNFQFKY